MLLYINCPTFFVFFVHLVVLSLETNRT